MYWAEERGSRASESLCPTTSERLRVLVAVESRLVAEALMFSLETDPQLEAIGYALHGWEALQHTATLAPDVVVVGPSLTGLDPLELSRLTHELFPQVLLIMLCERLVPAEVESAYSVGVADCLPVTRSLDELLCAIADARARRQRFERGRRRPTLTLVPPGGVDAHA
jgi:DNA-binding NarL/FixJ family response regulator